MYRTGTDSIPKQNSLPDPVLVPPSCMSFAIGAWSYIATIECILPSMVDHSIKYSPC